MIELANVQGFPTWNGTKAPTSGYRERPPA